MADAPNTTTDPEAGDSIVDDELNASAETRRTARFVTSALATIPTLGIIATLIKAPADDGSWALPMVIVGLTVAGAGAFVALRDFSQVLRPIGVSNRDVAGFDTSRIPGAPRPDHEIKETAGQQLLDSIETARADVTAEHARGVQLTVAAREKEAEAASLEANAVVLEADAKAAPGDAALGKAATQARRDADAAAATARSKAADVAGHEASASVPETQFARLNHIRANAMLLVSADEVRKRFETAMGHLPWNLAAIGIGVVLLAAAAQQPATAPQPPKLVTLTLTDAGRAAIGCEVVSVDAIQVGGTADAPLVITLPSTECPRSKTVDFQLISKAGPYGSFEVVKVITPSPSPSPT